MQNYSSTYTAVLATLLAPIAGNYFSDACAGEVSGVVAGTFVALISAGYLLIQRYKKGDITVLGTKR